MPTTDDGTTLQNLNKDGHKVPHACGKCHRKLLSLMLHAPSWHKLDGGAVISLSWVGRKSKAACTVMLYVAARLHVRLQ